PHVRSSRHSGFQYVFDTTRVSNGRHELSFVARTRNGRRGQLSASVLIKNLATRYDRYRRQTAPNAAAQSWMRRNAAHLPYRPKVSLLLAAQPSTDGPALAATLQSLAAQAYDDWQLRITGAEELTEKARRQIAQLARGDQRIRLVERSDWTADAEDAEWI